MAKGTPDPDYILRRDSCPIFSLCFMRDECWQYLLSGNQNGELCIWDLRTRQIKQTLDIHSGSVLGVTACGDLMVTHGRDSAVNIWKKEHTTLEKSASVRCASSGFCKVCIISHHQPSILVMPTDSSVIDLVSFETCDKLASCVPPQGPTSHGMVMCMAEVNANSFLGGYEDGSTILWDMTQQKLLSTSKLYQETVMCITFSHVCHRGVMGSVCNVLKMFTIDDDGQINVIKEMTITNPGVNCLAFRTDGKLFASGGWDGQVRIFSTKKASLLALLTFHASSVQALCFNDDNSLAVGGKDGAVSVWSVYK